MELSFFSITVLVNKRYNSLLVWTFIFKAKAVCIVWNRRVSIEGNFTTMFHGSSLHFVFDYYTFFFFSNLQHETTLPFRASSETEWSGTFYAERKTQRKTNIFDSIKLEGTGQYPNWCWIGKLVKRSFPAARSASSLRRWRSQHLERLRKRRAIGAVFKQNGKHRR